MRDDDDEEKAGKTAASLWKVRSLGRASFQLAELVEGRLPYIEFIENVSISVSDELSGSRSIFHIGEEHKRLDVLPPTEALETGTKVSILVWHSTMQCSMQKISR